MKNIKILSICFVMLILTACQNDDDYVAPDTLSDISWFTSVFSGEDFNRAVEQSISFMDVSQGATSHEWIIDEGNYFLKSGFNSEKDSLPDFKNPDLGLRTEDKTVHVLFMKEGINQVCLKNTFSEQVTFQSVDGPISATQQGDEWVFEKCFDVDVYAKHIKPAFKVFQDGNEILNVTADQEIKASDSDTWPIVDVEVNKTLTFVDMSTVGRPNERTWRIAGTPEVSNDSVAEVAFLKFGTTTEIGRIESSRIAPRPNRTDWKLIPLKVRVVSSSAPFEILSGITEDASEKLSFQVAGTIDAASLFGQNGNFTVNVTNATSGFNQNIAVQSIGVSSSDATVLELTLAEPIYNTDVVTISYAGGGIQSSDERALEDFSNITVQPHYAGSLTAPDSRLSFEVEEDRGAGGNTAGWWDERSWFFGSIDDVTAADGIRVMRFQTDTFETAPANSNLWGLPGGDLTALVPEAGTYRVSIKFYRETGSSVSNITTIASPDWIVSSWDFSASNGNWVTVENDIVTTGGLNRFDIQMRAGDNPGVTGPQTLYIDDIQIIPLEVRP